MRLRSLFLLSFIITSAFSQNFKSIPPEDPKLIVGITVGQFRMDYISRFWDKLSDGGIKKLVTEGANCKNNKINYLYSQEGVGQASISTGTTPSNHGIVGESWYLPLQDVIVKAAYDEYTETVGGKFEAGKYSPKHLNVSSFADEIKLSNNFKSKSFGVALHPSPAIFSVGHSADAAYWFDFDLGTFISSNYYMDSLPTWVNEFNLKGLPEVYIQKEWNTLFPIEDYNESLEDKNDYELGIKKKTEFPYNIGQLNNKGWGNAEYGIFEYIPFGDVLAKDFAIYLIVSEELGKDEYTDYLSLNFTSIERIGRLYGPISVELEDAILRLDREIEHFLKFLDAQVGRENLLVFFTSDHGVSYPPRYLTDNKMAAGYFVDKSAETLLGSYLNAFYEKGDWIKLYTNQQIYLNRNLIENAKLNLADFQNNVAQFMLQFTGVANTTTATILQSTNFDSGILNSLQNTYNQKRSGDVFINLDANWIEKSSGITGHLSGYSYDVQVPLVWYGWKIKRNTIYQQTNIIDIAPTICNLLEITAPSTSTGNPLGSIIK